MRLNLTAVFLYIALLSLLIQSASVYIDRSAPAWPRDDATYQELQGMDEWLYGPYLCVDMAYSEHFSIYTEQDWNRCRGQESTFIRHDHTKNVSTKLIKLSVLLGAFAPFALLFCLATFLLKKLRERFYTPNKLMFFSLLIVSLISLSFNLYSLVAMMAS